MTRKQDVHSHRQKRISRSRRRGQRRAALVLNMAPMIDMTFLLFSFVLVTSNFERPEGLLASQMPQNAGAPSVALPFSPIVVRLTQSGPADNDVELRIDRFAESARPIADLAGLLLEIHEQPGFDKDTPVILVADDEVRWDHVVNAWNAALRAGCTRVAFSSH
jgi:biopolymer transport protein ExbD